MIRRIIVVAILMGFLALAGLSQQDMGKGRISGVVADESGAPVEGALVVAQSLRSETKLETRSDAKGKFAIAGLGTGNWRIAASKEGYGGASLDMNIRQLGTNPPITFTLKKVVGAEAVASNKEALAMLDQGNALLTQENYDQALLVFTEFQGKYPEIYQVHLNIGTCYLRKGELDNAEAEFKLVLEKTMEVHGDLKKDTEVSLRALTGLGEVALRRGDLDSAQKHFAQAVDISPQDEAAAYNVGELLFSNQKIDEAIHYLELATQIKKDWSKPYLKLGYVYLNKGDFAKSLENFNTFIQLDPENPEVAQVKSIMETIEKMKK
ncbi:MAG: TPR-repeat-containing protein [Candidatus Aminicenantes bacterium]|nr:TPR-repeat-containing protein [Candidatus Aminicenantes bacterium]